MPSGLSEMHTRADGRTVWEDACRCEAETATSAVLWKSDKVFVVKKIDDLDFDDAGAWASN